MLTLRIRESLGSRSLRTHLASVVKALEATRRSDGPQLPCRVRNQIREESPSFGFFPRQSHDPRQGPCFHKQASCVARYSRERLKRVGQAPVRSLELSRQRFGGRPGQDGRGGGGRVPAGRQVVQSIQMLRII
jgi:hypothetical protein